MILIREMIIVNTLICRKLLPLLNQTARTMSSAQVYVTRADVPPCAVNMLKEKGYQVEIWSGTTPVPREELLKRVVNKNALFCLLTDKVDAEVLDKAGSSLKVISTMSVGYEHLDIEEIKKRNIKIGYTPGVLTAAVAELTIALLLATSRRLFESHEAMINGKWSAWSPLWMCGPSVRNSTVGIFGFGRIGQEVAKLITPFQPKSILYTSRSVKNVSDVAAERVEFDELLAQSDFLIVTSALTPETKEIFNTSVFTKMKSNCIFINTSRGGLVKQDDLIDALTSNKILAAGLDVMTPEPIPVDHPLLKLKNCVVIPHIGSASLDTRNEMAILTAKNIIAALENQALPAEL